MATVYFTNNSDSGDGSLRAALASASAGDTIAPDPNVAWNGDIEIALESVLPSKSISIVGTPEHRIVLNGQGVNRFYNVSTSLNITFQYVDFKNGYRSDAAPFYISRLGAEDSWTFESCRFYGGSGNYAGGIQLASANTTGTVALNNCVAFNNTARGTYNSTIPCPAFLYVASASLATVTINGCTLAKESNRAAVGGTGGTVTKTNSLIDGENSVDFANAGFVDATNCDFRLTATSPYLTGGASTGTDFLGHARSGSIGAFDGSYFVVAANGTAKISANTTIDYLEVGAGATVSFSGTDRILAATEGATVGAATFSATTGSTGYLALPSGASTSSATLTGVKATTYGASVTSFSASRSGQNIALTWTETTGKSFLIEKSTDNGATWETVAASTPPYSFLSVGAASFRTFDGVSFVERGSVAAYVAPRANFEAASVVRYGWLKTSNTIGYLN
ncbi:MAG: hypothetical protein IJM30_13020 [Thermoguttaceae bacterium]|nr:hypothetical protein [Thermoguttaceae bacterium]